MSGGDVQDEGYAKKEASGAPRPLVPRLATLSMLPASQWQNLVHLDAIKACTCMFVPAYAC